MGFLSKIFDPGKGDRKRAKKLLDESVLRGGDISGPGGIGAGFSFDEGGAGTSQLSLGSFQQFLPQFQNLAGQGFEQAGAGIPGLESLGQRTQDRLGNIDVQRFQNQQDFQGLGDIFQSSLATAQADPFDLGAGISERLRALSERRNQRSVNKFFDRLKSTGNLTSSAGIQRAGDLERNLFEQGLQFDLAGLQAGQGIQRDAFGRALGASGQREQIGARQFGEEFNLEQLGGNRALQQFGVGNEVLNAFLRNQQQGANIGSQGIQGGIALAQSPLAFLQAQLGIQSARSGTQGTAAAGFLNSAQQAKSPFLEALNAAGSFIGSVKPGGI